MLFFIDVFFELCIYIVVCTFREIKYFRIRGRVRVWLSIHGKPDWRDQSDIVKLDFISGWTMHIYHPTYIKDHIYSPYYNCTTSQPVIGISAECMLNAMHVASLLFVVNPTEPTIKTITWSLVSTQCQDMDNYHLGRARSVNIVMHWRM